MAISCDPASLANAARCWNAGCVTGTALTAARTYLLCQLASNGISDQFIPQNFQFVILNGMTAFGLLTWNSPPSGVISTEVWGSTDNVNFTLVDTVLSPTATSTILNRSSPYYAKIRFQTGGGPHAFTTVKNINYGTTWSARVVAAGGAAPAAAFVNGVNDYCDQMARGNTLREIYSCNFPSDSLTSVLVSVIDHIGTGLLTNHGFVGGDLTVNGLKGDGVGKWLDAGYTTTDIQLGQDPLSGPYPDPLTSFSFVFMDSLDFESNSVEIASSDGIDGNKNQALYAHFSDSRTYWDSPNDATLGRELQVNVGAFATPILVMGLRIATNSATVPFFQNSTGIRPTGGTGNNIAGAPLSGALYRFWTLDGTQQFSPKRGAYFHVAQGFNSSNWILVANAIQNARVIMGGGSTT